MRFASLDEWLQWQDSLHPREIDLGLERVERVLHCLGLGRSLGAPVITIGGTNGKGSCGVMLEGILSAAGYRVGLYSSPHLIKYNERIKINGQIVTDAALCEAFERIDQARLVCNGDDERLSLTYFEFGTLAALDLFVKNKLDVILLEVGMGGRLDAVNVVDSDVALVTTVDLDHQQWLGNDRETIGFEKAGIFRANRPAVCADLNPPQSLLEYARSINTRLYCAGIDYQWRIERDHWCWIGPEHQYDDLPPPALMGDIQFQNAAAAIMVLETLQDFRVKSDDIRRGMKDTKLAGRFQRANCSRPVYLDVAHNPQSARALAKILESAPVDGRTHGVIGMLQDKDVGEVVKTMAPNIDYWYGSGVQGSRGMDAQKMGLALKNNLPGVKLCVSESVPIALSVALSKMQKGDRMVVFGSFYTVADALRYFKDNPQ